MNDSDTKLSVEGEHEEGLPGAKTVARAEGSTWKALRDIV